MSEIINPNSFEDVTQQQADEVFSKVVVTKEEMKELEYKELLARYRVLLKHGDSITILNQKCFCDAADAAGNTPGLGMIWVRQKEAPREILGAVSIFDGRFFTLEEVNNKLIRNIPDRAALIRLYEELYPRKTFFQKLKSFFKR